MIIQNMAACKLDLSTYSYLPADVPAFAAGNGVINVSLSNGGSDWGDSLHILSLRFQLCDAQRLCIETEQATIEIKSIQSADWLRFLNTHSEKLLDTVVAKLLFLQEADDVLLLISGLNNQVWVLTLLAETPDTFCGNLVELERPDFPKVDYAYNHLDSREEQEWHFQQSLAHLKSWLPDDFLLLLPHQAWASRCLTVKVENQELWFLRFPLLMFAQLNYDGFGRYEEVEWIVTAKGIVQSWHERTLLRNDLTDLRMLLKHTAVIVNTYAHHEKRHPICIEGVNLLTELFHYFQNVNLNGSNLCLKWYHNPPASVMKQCLTDEENLYIFAAFEAATGQWQLGEGRYRAWNLPDETPSSTDARSSQGVEFLLEGEGNYLAHVRLMRVFHCNSVFDPNQNDGRQPADGHSIVRHLLDVGAQRVEGGLSQENYLDFLCSLLKLLCGTEHFQFVLRMKCLLSRTDFTDLLARVNRFLLACNHDAITRKACGK